MGMGIQKTWYGYGRSERLPNEGDIRYAVAYQGRGVAQLF